MTFYQHHRDRIDGVYRDGELVYSTLEIQGLMYFSDDGMCILAVPRNWRLRDEYFPPTIQFFKQGELVHEHSALDLLQHGEESLVVVEYFAPWFVYWYGDFLWLRYHDREADTLRITTVEGRDVIFSLQTGEILSVAPTALSVQEIEEAWPGFHIEGQPWLADFGFSEPEPAATFPWRVVIALTAAAFLGVAMLVIVLHRRKNQRRMTNCE
ncbi:MAG: hypothetical protein FWB76_08285 [Oscillospiraceae bacterium]|nr:hypothetical protein [Oscillospiraceae bacterium]